MLTAQRDLYAAQQTLIDAQLARLSTIVSLYKALGGGWLPTTAQAEATEPKEDE